MAADVEEVRPPADAGRSPGRRWLARLSFLLAAAAVAVLAVEGGLASIAMLAVGVASAAVSLAAGFWFLAGRGLWRWLALCLLIASPIAALIAFAFANLLWVAAASAAAWLLAGLAARVALAPSAADWRMPEFQPASMAARPFLIMNPRSGGGKVGKFDLKRKAEELGAEVFLMSGPERVDVADVARQAVANGADLLGVAGGDGTQALVAEVAADHEIPFVVITAGTRNHFALDLGLDREDPAACLGALTDGVDLRVDLGRAGTKTFVNNASFGAYAEVVQSPAYRDDKIGATLNLLPDLLSGGFEAPLAVRAHDAVLAGPQAVLVGEQSVRNGRSGGPEPARPAGSRHSWSRVRQRGQCPAGRRPASRCAFRRAQYAADTGSHDRLRRRSHPGRSRRRGAPAADPGALHDPQRRSAGAGTP